MKTDKLTGPTNDAVAGLPGAEKAGLFCECVPPCYAFEQNRNMFCYNCGKDVECPVPPVNAAESGSSTGQESPMLEQEDCRTLFRLMRMQAQEIQDLNQSVKFLAEQVKTLIDGLAEDADPDEPITSYLSGKPL